MKAKKGKHAKAASAIAPLNFLLPSVAVAACVATTVMSYEPLVFDPSAFPKVNQAQAAPLTTVDTSEVERASAEPSTGASYSASDYAIDASNLADGTYTGSAYGFKSTITVQVTVEGGKIAAIVILSEADDAEYIARAKSVIPTVLAAQTTAVDTVSGATYSSEGILMAIKNALASAYKTAPEENAGEGGDTAATPGGAVTLPDDSFDPTDAEGYLDGEWTACVLCRNELRPSAFEPYYLMLTVVVENGEVTDIKEVCGSETGLEGFEALGPYDEENDDYLDRVLYGYSFRGTAYKGLLEQLLDDKVEPSAITPVSSATYSSESFAAAYLKALEASALAYEEAHGETPGDGGTDGDVDAPDSEAPGTDAPDAGDSGSSGDSKDNGESDAGENAGAIGSEGTAPDETVEGPNEAAPGSSSGKAAHDALRAALRKGARHV